jgi:hypothetical protein
MTDDRCDGYNVRRTTWSTPMPKRVIDFDAMWASDKIASCAD